MTLAQDARQVSVRFGRCFHVQHQQGVVQVWAIHPRSGAATRALTKCCRHTHTVFTVSKTHVKTHFDISDWSLVTLKGTYTGQGHEIPLFHSVVPWE